VGRSYPRVFRSESGDSAGRALVGVDVGGTFTDIVALVDGSDELVTLKVPTTPEDQSRGVLSGVERALPADSTVTGLVHGTTAITNALLEGRGAPVTLITTRGFRDVLEIGRYARDSLYDLQRPSRPAPLVPRADRLEVDERVLANGSIARSLNEDDLRRVVAEVVRRGSAAVAVCLLHSYANPAHERRVAAALASVAPHVCVSHRVNAEMREFERTSTTVLNAAVMPVADRYVGRLKQGLAELAPTASLHLVQSNGGMISADSASELPIRLVMSGPAAGVAAAQFVCRRLGIENAVTFDMGGTSTDVCLITGGEYQTSRQRSLDGRPVRLESVGVESIGAGGGSIAGINPVGALTVGPASAGARPGPAAYGLGGNQPTVTDANVALGLIRHGKAFGAGAVRVDLGLARDALAGIAHRLSMDVQHLAEGIVEIANSTMLRAIRLVTVQRGVDPRELTMIAYGGAGPLHATRLAELLSIPRVVIPAHSGVFSALGCLVSDLRYDVARTHRADLAAVDRATLATMFDRLVEEAREPLLRDGASMSTIRVRRSLDLRYAGQNYELTVPLGDGMEGLDHHVIRDAFRRQHEALYTYSTQESLQLVGLRVSARVPRGDLRMPPHRSNGEALLSRRVECVIPGHGAMPTSIYRRAGLAPSEPLVGPALVEDEQSTIVIGPGQVAECDDLGNLIVRVPS
jgi:N-methylhydantoinase A